MAKNQAIQYINPSDLSLFSYDGKHFQKLNKRENSYTVSRALYEDIVVYSFKIPANQSNDDLSSFVEIKMYEEAGLDVNKTYKITYLVKKLDFDEMCLVEAFAIDLEVLNEAFHKCIKKVKYIDFIALPFFSYTTFYTNKILTSKNDIFAYMGDDEAFLSFYRNGEYISTKSMINLNDIVEKLKAKEINITKEKLSDILKHKGFKQELYDEKESEILIEIETIFSEVLTKLNNVAMHNRSVFGFDNIDRIFFSTKQGRIKGLREFVLNFGFADVEVLDFNLFREKQESDFLDKIVCSYGLDKFKQNSNKQNISIFKKPPSFLVTQFGKLVISVVVFVLILSGIYVYFQYKMNSLENQKSILETKYNSIQKQAKLYKRQTREKTKEIIAIKKDMEKQDIIFKNIKSSIDKLEEIKGRDNRYTNFLAKVNLLLQKYQLKAKSIDQEGSKKMTIEVKSDFNSRDNISKFLKSLISEGFVNVKTDEIKLDNGKYISKIEIENE